MSLKSPRVLSSVALGLGLVLAGSASPAHSYQLYSINAPYIVNGSRHVVESLAYTHVAPFSCNDPNYSPCFNTFLQLEMYFENRWMPIGRTDSPNLPPPLGTPYVVGWSARGTCLTTPGTVVRNFRTVFEQKRHDQGSLFFTERVWLTNYLECRV